MKLPARIAELATKRSTRILALAGGKSHLSLTLWIPSRLPSRNTVTSDQFVVLYLLSGSGIYEDADGNQLKLSPGVFLQRLPDKPHVITRHADEPWLELAIRIRGPLFDNLVALDVIHPERLALYPGVDGVMFSRIETLANLFQSIPDWDTGHLLLELQHLFIDVYSRECASARDRELFDRIQEAARLLQESPGRPLSMPEVADAVGLGYHQFRKAFTENIGMAPKEYRLRRRVERAQELILEGRFSLDAIADELGYHDLAAFGKQFKRIAGLSPGAFRRNWS